MLDKDQVLEIKKMLDSKTSGSLIVKKFNINTKIVSRIKNGDTWSQVTGIGL